MMKRLQRTHIFIVISTLATSCSGAEKDIDYCRTVPKYEFEGELNGEVSENRQAYAEEIDSIESCIVGDTHKGNDERLVFYKVTKRGEKTFLKFMMSKSTDVLYVFVMVDGKIEYYFIQ